MVILDATSASTRSSGPNTPSPPSASSPLNRRQGAENAFHAAFLLLACHATSVRKRESVANHDVTVWVTTTWKVQGTIDSCRRLLDVGADRRTVAVLRENDIEVVDVVGEQEAQGTGIQAFDPADALAVTQAQFLGAASSRSANWASRSSISSSLTLFSR